MNLYTECVTKKDDVLYFVSSDSNFIFSFDIHTKSTEITTSIEECNLHHSHIRHHLRVHPYDIRGFGLECG